MDPTTTKTAPVRITYLPFCPFVEPLSRLEERMVKRFEEREAVRNVMRAQNRWLYSQAGDK